MYDFFCSEIHREHPEQVIKLQKAADGDPKDSFLDDTKP